MTGAAAMRPPVHLKRAVRAWPAGSRRPAAEPCPASPLSEAQLSFLWEGQRVPPDALVTRDGERLQVVYRGRLTRGPGPDFRDAILATATSELLRGDVELHLRASSFHQHGHHTDPRYDNLVLHLVWEDDEGGDTVLRCGRRTPVVALAPWVGRRAADLHRWLTQPALWREPCLAAVERLGADEVGRTLDRLGDLRFRQKQERLCRALSAVESSPRSRDRGSACGTAAEREELLWRAILTALGQREHAAAFAMLAEALPVEALLAATAGLAPATAADRCARLLVDEFQRLPVPLRPRGPRRPAADPRRRLAGAAHLLARRAGGHILAYARRWLEERGQDAGPLGLAAWEVRGGEGTAVSGAAPRPEGSQRQRAPGRGLIGRGRALELVVNAVLPFLAALGRQSGEAGLEERALALYRRLPEPEPYGATAFLDSALRTAGGRRLARGVRRRQGLLYLFNRYCTQGGCGRCPLS